MKKIYSLYCFFLSLLLLVSLFSCKDDFLNLQPLDAVTEASVWEDLDLMELYMNARYEELPHGFTEFAGGYRLTGLTDESYHMHEAHNLDRHVNGETSSENLFLFGGFWSEAYTAIRNNSIFLENTEAFIGNNSRVEQLRGEARFLRAFFYAELIARYGGVPLIKSSLNQEDNVKSIQRSSYEECVTYIIEELDLSISSLLGVQEASIENFGRASKGAAMALKARVLLYAASPQFNPNNDRNKWEMVAKACEDLFELKQYSLSNDYAGLFLNPSDSEVIFFKQFINEFGSINNGEDFDDGFLHRRGGHRIDEWRFPNGSGGWVSENPIQTFVDQYETISGKIPVLGYTGDSDDLQPILNPEATDYDPSQPFNNRDPRLEMSIYHNGSVFNGRALEMWDGGKDSRNPNVDFWWNGSRLGYGIRKSLDEDGWSLNSNFGSEQPWIYMRLSEFYLSYAEAQYFLDNEPVAIDYINRIRARQGVEMPPINASGSDLLEKIKHERKIELAFESNRWYDARRWNDAVTDFSQPIIGVETVKSGNNISYRYFQFSNERNFPEHQNLWPIPLIEIQRSNLTQNPGY
jgi:hypothetical protein